jgi:hypothetical protein
MASPKRDPVLTLSTVIDRPTILIDGTPYQMRAADELPWLVYRDKANVYQRASTLFTLRRRTPKQEQELTRLLPSLVASLMVDVPAKVLAKLTDDHRLAIVATFSQLLLANPQAVGAMAAAAVATPGRASSTRTGAR